MRAALQEAKLIAEKSMIGRLHNQLADMNFRKLRWEEDLDATAAQLAAAQAQARGQELQAPVSASPGSCRDGDLGCCTCAAFRRMVHAGAR